MKNRGCQIGFRSKSNYNLFITGTHNIGCRKIESKLHLKKCIPVYGADMNQLESNTVISIK